MINGAGIVVRQPHRFRAVRADRGAGQHQREPGVGKGAVGAFAPGGLYGGMMVFVADHQHPGGAAHRLQGVLQALNRRPGGADIQAQAVDIAIPRRDLAHVAAGDPPEIVGPLVDDLGARGDDHDPVDFLSSIRAWAMAHDARVLPAPGAALIRNRRSCRSCNNQRSALTRACCCHGLSLRMV